MTIKLTATGAFLAALSPLAAHAQDAVLLPPITASANLEDTEVDRSGSSVLIVTEDQLKASGDIRVSDYLATLPGINVTSNGPIGSQTGLTLRGASQNYIGVRVDGIDVTDPSGPKVAYNFGTLTTADISRIEVLEGSQSALYGSGAVGGVIDITTRRATQNGTEQSAALEYGSYNTLSGSYGFATKSDTHELAFTLSHVATDGFSAADENDGNTEADGYRADRLSFYSHVDLQNGLRLGATGFWEKSRGEYDPQFYADPATLAFDVPLGDGATPDEVTHATTAGLRLFGQFATGRLENEISASLFNIDRNYKSSENFLLYDASYNVIGSYVGANDYTYKGTRSQLRYQGDFQINPDMRVSFGGDLTFEDYDQSGSYGVLSADNRVGGLFVEWAYAPSEVFDVTLSARQDDHSEFGGFTTGRLAAVYRPRTDLILRGSVGTGFRAPSLYELNSLYGDPALQPEESLTADLGIEKRFGDTAGIRATVFYLRADNLIDFDYAATACGSGFGCYAQIPGVSERSGLELAGNMALSDALRLNAAYTYTDSSLSGSTAWASVPRNDLAVTLDADLAPNLSGTLTARHVWDRLNGLGDYTLVNVGASHAFGDSTEGYVRVENLFNTQYQTIAGYGTSDRALYVGLRKTF